MAARPTILLHLGAHKTGSTSIQRNFARHRGVLADRGLSYLGPGGPYPHLYSAFLADPMNYLWNQQSGLDRDQIDRRDREAMAQLDAQLAGVTTPLAMISNEFLAMLPPKRLDKLRGAMAHHGHVRAVYVYRELHGWISSNTQEMAKTGTATGPTPFDRALKRVVDFPLKIADVFGAEACVFLRFEDLAKGGLCSGFLRAFELPDFPTLGLEEKRENTGVSRPAVEALFAYNRVHPLGSPGRDKGEVERLKSLPGERYTAPAFTADEIRHYAEARARVTSLGLQLAAPEALNANP